MQTNFKRGCFEKRNFMCFKGFEWKKNCENLNISEIMTYIRMYI